MNGRQYMERVKQLPCVLCKRLGRETQPCDAHHIRQGQGASQKASDFLTVALCKQCHQGLLGVHGDRTWLKIANVTELDLLADTIQALHE